MNPVDVDDETGTLRAFAPRTDRSVAKSESG